MPDTPDEERLAGILGDWLERRDRGEAVPPEEVIRTHPDLAEALGARFRALGVLGGALAKGLPEGAPAAIGDFRLVREIGRGGMGVVYEAEQTSMRRRVALKVLSVGIAGTSHAVKRFQREAQVAGRLHHTNIVPVYAMGQHGGQWYYAMELVRGRPLDEVIAEMRAQGRAPSGASLADTGNRSYFVRAAEMFAGVAEALDLAHQEDTVHRDIKPANLMLDDDGFLKIVDFGIARYAHGDSMTVTGSLLGTPVYMSPEQAAARGVEVDHRTDVYSLGATIYETVTLSPPFEGRTLQEVCSQIVTQDPAPPRRLNPRVPRDLETIVLKAMEKERGRRYETAGALARDLRCFAEGAAIQARPVGPLGQAWRRVKRHRVLSAAAAAAALFAVACGVFIWREARETARRVELEYAVLCADAEREDLRARLGPLPDTTSERLQASLGAPDPGRASELFVLAIELAPLRYEAFLGRAMAHGRTDAERVEDLDRARARGAPAGAVALVRGRSVGGGESAGGGDPLEDLLRGRLLSQERRFAEAEAALTRTIAGAPPGSLLRFLALHDRSLARRGQLKYTEAIEDALALRAATVENLALEVEIAVLWTVLGREDRSAEILSALLEAAKAAPSERRWADLLRALGRVRPQLPCDRFVDEALRALPDSPAVRKYAALAMLAHACSLMSSSGVHDDAGRRSEEFAALERSIALHDRALQLNPRDAEVHANRGAALRYLSERQSQLAISDWNTRLYPGGAVEHSNRAQELRALGRLEDALAAYDRAIALDPRYAAAHNNQGVVLRNLGRTEEAIKAHTRAIDLDPRNAKFHFDRSISLNSLGRSEAAMASAERALELEPNEPALINGVAWFLATAPDPGLRDLPRAVALAKEAVRREPRHGGYWNTLGVAHYRAGDWTSAVAVLEKAMELNSGGHAWDWFFFAMARWQLGEKEDARRWYEMALSWTELVEPEHEELRRFRMEAAELLGVK